MTGKTGTIALRSGCSGIFTEDVIGFGRFVTALVSQVSNAIAVAVGASWRATVGSYTVASLTDRQHFGRVGFIVTGSTFCIALQHDVLGSSFDDFGNFCSRFGGGQEYMAYVFAVCGQSCRHERA
jgi:hypothetical protein